MTTRSTSKLVLDVASRRLVMSSIITNLLFSVCLEPFNLSSLFHLRRPTSVGGLAAAARPPAPGECFSVARYFSLHHTAECFARFLAGSFQPGRRRDGHNPPRQTNGNIPSSPCICASMSPHSHRPRIPSESIGTQIWQSTNATPVLYCFHPGPRPASRPSRR